MKSEQELPHGFAWHNSYEKRKFDAMIATRFGWLAIAISESTLKMLQPYDYCLFTQARIGQYGLPFDMYKIQTMESTAEPLLNKTPILPVAQMVRSLAFDELVQICHVSTNPEKLQTMSIVGPRPQLAEEISHMRETMTRAGREEQFCRWFSAYCAMRPGLFSVETFATERYEPHTLELYEARANATIWYYENARYELDMLTFATNVALGSYRYHCMRLLDDTIKR